MLNDTGWQTKAFDEECSSAMRVSLEYCYIRSIWGFRFAVDVCVWYIFVELFSHLLSDIMTVQFYVRSGLTHKVELNLSSVRFHLEQTKVHSNSGL